MSPDVTLSDFNFKIEETDFKLSVLSAVDGADPYDQLAPQGSLSENKNETALTFAYAYETKDSEGNKTIVNLCQNGSIISQQVSNKSDAYNSVSELNNIIFDSVGLKEANDALPMAGNKIDINKIYNKIQITIPEYVPPEDLPYPHQTSGHWLKLPWR